MAFIDHGHKTGAIVEDVVEELTAPPEGSIFTCEWDYHRGGYYSIGCRPGKEPYLDAHVVEEFGFCPYCGGVIDVCDAVVEDEDVEY